MEKHWTIQRTAFFREDAQLRWDLAYQCLLKWAQLTVSCQVDQEEEAPNESRHVCPSIYTRPSRDPDH